MHNCLSADSRRTKDTPLHNPCTDYNVLAVAWLSGVLAASHELWVQACFRRLSGSVRLPGFRFQRNASAESAHRIWAGWSRQRLSTAG
jgi:hypothetical protein